MKNRKKNENRQKRGKEMPKKGFVGAEKNNQEIICQKKKKRKEKREEIEECLIEI